MDDSIDDKIVIGGLLLDYIRSEAVQSKRAKTDFAIIRYPPPTVMNKQQEMYALATAQHVSFPDEEYEDLMKEIKFRAGAGYTYIVKAYPWGLIYKLIPRLKADGFGVFYPPNDLLTIAWAEYPGCEIGQANSLCTKCGERVTFK